LQRDITTALIRQLGPWVSNKGLVRDGGNYLSTVKRLV
jgi:hypothetical protein